MTGGTARSLQSLRRLGSVAARFRAAAPTAQPGNAALLWPVDGNSTGSSDRRTRMRQAAIVLVLVLAAAACSGGGDSSAPEGSGPTRATSGGSPSSSLVPGPGRVTVRVVVPWRTIRAGSSRPARVVVSNATGSDLNLSGCGSPFQVALVRPGISPEVAWLACLQRITIPSGESSYPVTVRATYNSCSGSIPPAAGAVACLPNQGPPPLPTGNYRAKLFQSPTIGPAPSPIEIRVVRR